MTNNYEVKTQEFSGPLDKLLELVEEKKLEIARVSLGEVTADFLDYLKKFGGNFEPRILADFVVVAAQLVLIKSKILLPSLELTQEEEVSIGDLELRLRIYKEFAARYGIKSASQGRSASQYLNNLWNANQISYARTLFMSLGEAQVFYPAPNLNLENFKKSMNNLVSALRELFPETHVIKAAIVTLEEKIQELLKRCQAAVKESFNKLSQNRSRSEVVVMFLAMLHLFHDKVIEVEQKNQFGDIMMKIQNSEGLNGQIVRNQT